MNTLITFMSIEAKVVICECLKKQKRYIVYNLWINIIINNSIPWLNCIHTHSNIHRVVHMVCIHIYTYTCIIGLYAFTHSCTYLFLISFDNDWMSLVTMVIVGDNERSLIKGNDVLEDEEASEL